MEVRLIKTTDYKEPKKANILATATVGGLAGYGFKYLHPLDRDEIYMGLNGEHKEKIKNKGIKARTEKYEALKKLPKYKEAVDIFDKMNSNVPEERVKGKTDFANASENIKEQVKKIRNKLKLKSSLAKTHVIKQSRPWSVYVVPGAILGVIGAITYNIIGELKTD